MSPAKVRGEYIMKVINDIFTIDIEETKKKKGDRGIYKGFMELVLWSWNTPLCA